MISEQMTAKEVFAKYKEDMLKLIAYQPWLEEKSGNAKMYEQYQTEGMTQNSMKFPVYDGTLLRFVREAENTVFMDRNYVYVISGNRLKSAEDEKAFVRKQTMLGMDNIGGVLSKYVMGGKVKGRMWSDAMDQGIFLEIVNKLKELYGEGLNFEVG